MRLVQNSFVGGEISPALFGRHDIEAYFHAAKRITNFTVHGTGGLGKRYGTQLLAKLGTGATSSFKAFSYLYDRTHWMFLLHSAPIQPFRSLRTGVLRITRTTARIWIK